MSTERMTLAVTTREVGNKGVNRRLRASGLIPGVVYGKGAEGTPVAIEPKRLEEVLTTEYGFNAVFHLAVEGGETHLVMVKDRQFDPIRREITHIDFYKVDDEQIVEVDVPVRPVGVAAGVKMGGRLLVVSRAVKVRAAVKDIPATVDHDVTAMQVSEALYIDEMTPPSGCEFVYKNRFPVINIQRKRGAKVGGDEAEAAAPAS